MALNPLLKVKNTTPTFVQFMYYAVWVKSLLMFSYVSFY